MTSSCAKGFTQKYCYLFFRIPPRVEGYHVFDKWHVAFYGTLIGRLRRILDLGDIPLQGINPQSQCAGQSFLFSLWLKSLSVIRNRLHNLSAVTEVQRFLVLFYSTVLCLMCVLQYGCSIKVKSISIYHTSE